MTSPSSVSLDILPPVLTEDSLLDALRTGGVLKFGTETVMMAMRAALAERTGVYEVAKEILRRVEAQAEALEEPIGESFFKLRDQVTRSRYADIFAAIPGSPGQYVTEARKRTLLEKLNTRLWPALYGFQQQLQGWVNAWQQGMANPGAMMVAMTSIMAGGAGALPPGMIAPPPTDSLHDAADGVVNAINPIFAGTGTIIASALGHDAKRIMDVLSDPTLPMQMGLMNREQMLKALRINVAADFTRLATNITRFALAIIKFKDVTSGNEELAYITAMFQLGAVIPWDQLMNVSKAGIGTGVGKFGKGRTGISRDEDEDEDEKQL